MAVFPPASGHALPEAYRTLMVHPASPIIDFYPIDFRADLNGKKFSWQAIAILPFIDAARLRSSLAPLAVTLDEDEAERNELGDELLFANSRSSIGRLCAAHCSAPGGVPLVLEPTSANSPSFGGILEHAGKRIGVAGSTLPPPPNGRDYGMHPIERCASAAPACRRRVPPRAPSPKTEPEPKPEPEPGARQRAASTCHHRIAPTCRGCCRA